jgi:hypothetical protein
MCLRTPRVLVLLPHPRRITRAVIAITLATLLQFRAAVKPSWLPGYYNSTKRIRRQSSTHKPLRYLTPRRVRQVRRVDLQFLTCWNNPPVEPELPSNLPMKFEGIL